MGDMRDQFDRELQATFDAASKERHQVELVRALSREDPERLAAFFTSQRFATGLTYGHYGRMKAYSRYLRRKVRRSSGEG